LVQRQRFLIKLAAIVLDNEFNPCFRKIFWSDYGPESIDGKDVGMVASANLDGSAVENLVSDTYGPRGIAVDSDSKISN